MKLSNLVGQALDGKYLIEKQLGKGGMGAVFFATHLGTERPVAVKVIMPQYMKHDEFVERFRREARAAGRLRHPNVVDVTDFGFASVEDEQVAYLVMEYLDGCTLDEVLAEEEKLPFQFTLEILEQVCSAVEEAHNQGIIHRDLKPDNIWLEPNRRGSYTVKVLDFGIAKLEETILGTDEQNSDKEDIETNSITGKFSAVDSDESGTLLFGSKENSLVDSVAAYQASEFTEGSTQMQPAVSSTHIEEITEAETREMSIAALVGVAKKEDAATKHLGAKPTGDTQHVKTSSASALTRIGSVLGTPLYMSPEQCKGKTLDVRSDVYSLGVIAYQMLSGATPFKGEYQDVMKAHIDEKPPMLKVKGVRKKASNVIMNTLDKSPENRPRSAAAFASILRANSEGVGILFQRALTFLSRHIQSITKLALIVFAPMIIITLLQVTNNLLLTYEKINNTVGTIAAVLLGLLSTGINFFTTAVMGGLTAWIVTGINAAPLRPIELKPAFEALRRRIKPFIWTTFLSTLIMGLTMVVSILLATAVVVVLALTRPFIGVVLFWVFVGIIALGCVALIVFVMSRYALVAAITLLEGLRGRAALRRSVELTKRSRRTVFTTVFIQFIFPVILAVAIGSIIGVMAKNISSKDEKKATQETSQNTSADKSNPAAQKENQNDVNIEMNRRGVRIGPNLGDESKEKRNIVSNIYQLFWLPVSVVLVTFTAIVTSLLYLKTRQAGGENIRDVLEEFDEDKPRSKWQTKMRERLSLHTRVSKG